MSDLPPLPESSAPLGDYDFSVSLGARLAAAVAAVWDPDVLPAPPADMVANPCPLADEIATDVSDFVSHVIADLLLWADACELDANGCLSTATTYFHHDVPSAS